MARSALPPRPALDVEVTSSRDKLVRSLLNRHLIVLLIALIGAAGFGALSQIPRIEDPRITTRNAIITTSVPGASALRVEALVSKPIEESLLEVEEIKTVSSTSRANMSVVTVELEDWVGPNENELAFSKIRDRLADVRTRLPDFAAAPELDDKRGAVAYSILVALKAPARTKNAQSVHLGQSPVTVPDHTLGLLSRTAEKLADELRNLSGTDQVLLFGEVDEEIAVELAPAEIAAMGLSPQHVAKLIAQADSKAPGGTVRSPSTRLPVEVAGELDSLARISAIPILVNQRGGQTTLGDVAQIRRSWADPPRNIALLDGHRSVFIAARTREDIRLDLWSRKARELIEKFRLQQAGGAQVEILFEQNRYTESRLTGLLVNLGTGAGVVMLIVWMTMGWRSALVVGTALPLSAALSVFGLSLADQQIHQMSIFGLIIALGLLIDSAIVVTDAVVSRMRQGVNAVQAIRGSLDDLAAPLFASTFTTVLGFMPVFLLPGNVGDFVSPIATAVVLALIASYLLSLTIVPALAAISYGTRGRAAASAAEANSRETRHGRIAALLRRFFAMVLMRPWRAVAASLVLPIAGFVVVPTLNVQFFPPSDRDQLEVQVWMPPTAPLQSTHETVASIDNQIRSLDGILSTHWVVGASSPPVYYNQLRNIERDASYARGVLRVADASRVDDLQQKLQADLGHRFVDARIVVKPFGQGPPIESPLEYRLVGPETDGLRQLGEELRAILQSHPDVTITRATIEGGRPQLNLMASETKAKAAGLTLGDISEQFRVSLDGTFGGSVLEDLQAMPVRVRVAQRFRTDPSEVSSLRLWSPNHADWVSAHALGDMVVEPVKAQVSRRNSERVNIIRAHLRANAMPIEVAAQLQARLENWREGWAESGYSNNYRLEQGGDAEEQGQAVGLLLTYTPVLAVLMLATLVLTFSSFTLGAGLVGSVSILSVGLGMLSLWIGDFALGFNPLLGLAGLVGVAINGSIIVLSAIRRDPIARSGDLDAMCDVLRNASRHIVSTTLTTVAGLCPLLFSGGDFWPPLAAVIAGGVGLGIVLSLVYTPCVYLLLARLSPRLIGVHGPASKNSSDFYSNQQGAVVGAY